MMKSMTCTGWLLLAILGLYGCGSSSSGPPLTTPAPEDEEGGYTHPIEVPPTVMALDELYEVQPDDRLVTTSPSPALIELVYAIDLETGGDLSRVRLLEGDAELYQ